MEHFREKLGLAALLALIASVFGWGASHDISTTIYIGLGSLVCVVLVGFCGMPLYHCYVDYRSHLREVEQARHSRQLEQKKLALEHKKHTDTISLDQMRIALEQQKQQTAHLMAVLENQIKAQHVRIEEIKVNRPALTAPTTTQQQTGKGDENIVIPQPFDLEAALRTFRPSPNGIYLGRSAGPTGYSTDVIVPLSKLWHIALTGPTGGGKSNILLLILSQLLCDAIRAEVYLADPHYAPIRYTDDRQMIDWRPVEQRLANAPLYDTKTIAEMLQDMAYGELSRRIDLRRRGDSTILTPLYIAIDEFPVIAAEQPEALPAVGKLLRQGRQFGMFTISATQDMLVKTIGGSSGIRECYRTGFYTGGDATTARAILDLPQGQKADVEGLGDRGLVYLKTATTSAQIVRVPFASNTACYTLLGEPVSEGGNSGNGPETPRQAVESNVFPFPTTDPSLSTNQEKAVGNEVRETVRRMKQKGMKDRDIAPLVGLGGRKYTQYQQLITELGLESAIEMEA